LDLGVDLHDSNQLCSNIIEASEALATYGLFIEKGSNKPFLEEGFI
jgi:hypothetical protein